MYSAEAQQKSYAYQKTGGSLTAFRNSEVEPWVWFDPGEDGSVTSFSKSGEGFSPRDSWKRLGDV